MIKIRRMLPSDFQHVGPLYRKMVLEQPKPYPSFDDLDKEVEEFTFFGMAALSKFPQCFAAVALDGGVSKGFLWGSLTNRVVGNPRVYFLGEVVYVEPNFRHKGIGQLLLNYTAEWAVSKGAGAFEVNFTPGSEAHIKWARMGFRSYMGAAVFADENWKPVLDYPKFKSASRSEMVRSESGSIGGNAGGIIGSKSDNAGPSSEKISDCPIEGE